MHADIRMEPIVFNSEFIAPFTETAVFSCENCATYNIKFRLNSTLIRSTSGPIIPEFEGIFLNYTFALSCGIITLTITNIATHNQTIILCEAYDDPGENVIDRTEPFTLLVQGMFNSYTQTEIAAITQDSEQVYLLIIINFIIILYILYI